MNKLQVSKAAQKDLQEIKAYLAVDLENPGVAVAAVSEDKPKSKANASANKQEKVTVQHKESNKQMDNLF